ncbi:MAG: hypothetical protein AAB337_02285 [Patescibacteria group bacterium]
MAGTGEKYNRPWRYEQYPPVAFRHARPWCEQIYGYRAIEFDPLAGGLCRIRIELICTSNRDIANILRGSWEFAWTRALDDQRWAGCVHLVDSRPIWGCVVLTEPCRVEPVRKSLPVSLVILRPYVGGPPFGKAIREPALIKPIVYIPSF